MSVAGPAQDGPFSHGLGAARPAPFSGPDLRGHHDSHPSFPSVALEVPSASYRRVPELRPPDDDFHGGLHGYPGLSLPPRRIRTALLRRAQRAITHERPSGYSRGGAHRRRAGDLHPLLRHIHLGQPSGWVRLLIDAGRRSLVVPDWLSLSDDLLGLRPALDRNDDPARAGGDPSPTSRTCHGRARGRQATRPDPRFSSLA